MAKTDAIIKYILFDQIKANKAYSLKADKIYKNRDYNESQKGERLASLAIRSVRETANNCTMIFKLIEAMGGNDELAASIYGIFKNPYQLTEQHEAFKLLEDLEAEAAADE